MKNIFQVCVVPFTKSSDFFFQSRDYVRSIRTQVFLHNIYPWIKSISHLKKSFYPSLLSPSYLHYPMR